MKFEVLSNTEIEKILTVAKKGLDFVIVEVKDWKIIPLENIIAKLHKINTKIYAIANTPEEVRKMFSILEVGVDGVINPKINQAQIMDLATGRFMEDKASVLIVGPTGTGKSHLAQALGHEAIRRGYDVSFTTQSKLGGQLQAARATQSYDRRLTALASVDLLIIDDFGLKPLQSPQDEDFHDLISERYERRPTMVTSNLAFSGWAEAFPNRLLGAAVIDRLRHGAYQVILDGETYRAPRSSPQVPKKPSARRDK